MYVFVRKDLSHSQQVVQTAHACIEATKEFLRDGDQHPHLVVFGVKNQTKLRRCLEHLEASGIPYKEFVEPDIGHEITAVATAPLKGEIRSQLSKYCLL